MTDYILQAHHTDTERRLLAQLMTHREYISLCDSKLPEEAFADWRTRIIYTAIIALYKAHAPIIDAQYVAQYIHVKKLDRNNIFQGTLTVFIADLFSLDVTYSREMVEIFTDKILDAYQQRKMSLSLQQLSQRLDEGDIELSEMKAALYDSLSQLESRDGNYDEPVNVMERALDEFGVQDFLPLRYPQLNALLGGGFHQNALYILAARPSMGKTTFAINLMSHIAEMGRKILFFSLEVADTVVYYKMAGIKSRQNFTDVREKYRKNPDDPEAKRFFESMLSMDYQLWIRRERELSSILSICRDKHVLNKGLDLIVIDHINLVSVKGQSNTTERVSEVSAALKELAMELKVPVLALSQLNRDLTKRDDKRPMLNDLRGSGSIEQDADVVMFLHREAYFDHEITGRAAHEMEVNIAKNRDGATGTVTMLFDRNTGCIGLPKDARGQFAGEHVSKRTAEEAADLFS